MQMHHVIVHITITSHTSFQNHVSTPDYCVPFPPSLVHFTFSGTPKLRKEGINIAGVHAKALRFDT